eukprot:CAMPEP_0185833324 /NCGR_PEP_ID=MMETSP1353-20130828/2608_1 /TAXON_ID=1077150 /ORGANISM="Erythrolobus australicus, Strain CCMP3124" /LENGTH=178 /DNA_ID=CAMNT_0028531593 /DNA_START=510 /DNA_END=1044 /DNA_ORIENTATION=-
MSTLSAAAARNGASPQDVSTLAHAAHLSTAAVMKRTYRLSSTPSAAPPSPIPALIDRRALHGRLACETRTHQPRVHAAHPTLPRFTLRTAAPLITAKYSSRMQNSSFRLHFRSRFRIRFRIRFRAAITSAPAFAPTMTSALASALASALTSAFTSAFTSASASFPTSSPEPSAISRGL